MCLQTPELGMETQMPSFSPRPSETSRLPQSPTHVTMSVSPSSLEQLLRPTLCLSHEACRVVRRAFVSRHSAECQYEQFSL